MTDKGFGINIPENYVPHPTTAEECQELVGETYVRSYQRLNMRSCKYLYTTFVALKRFVSRKMLDVSVAMMPAYLKL